MGAGLQEQKPNLFYHFLFFFFKFGTNDQTEHSDSKLE